MSCAVLKRPSFLECHLATVPELPFLEKTLTQWKDFILRIEDKISNDQELGILEDYKCVLFMIQDDVDRQKYAKDRLIFFVKKDAKTEGISSGHAVLNPVSKDNEFQIDTLVTAPWNLNFTIFKDRPRTKGVGTILLDSMLESANLCKADIVKFDATGSSISFYKNLGFSLKHFNTFYCDPKNEELRNKIKEIVQNLFKIL